MPSPDRRNMALHGNMGLFRYVSIVFCAVAAAIWPKFTMTVWWSHAKLIGVCPECRQIFIEVIHVWNVEPPEGPYYFVIYFHPATWRGKREQIRFDPYCCANDGSRPYHVVD